jgi:hypothetical protein
MSDNKQIIAGFPELLYEPRCRLCRLAFTDPGVLKLINKTYNDKRTSAKLLHAKMVPVFERHQLSVPSEYSFKRHIKTHLDISRMATPKILAEFELPDIEESRLTRLVDDEMQLRTNTVADLALGTNDSDYHNMADLFRRLMRRIAAVDGDPTSFVNPEGENSLQKLNVWASMIEKAKGIIEGLNKMRNTDRMTVSILEQHTKKYATAVAGPIASIIRTVRDELLNGQDTRSQELAARLTILLDKDVAEILTSAAVKSMRESREQFKLMN